MVKLDTIIKQQHQQMQKILIRSRKRTIESLNDSADKLDDLHTDTNNRKANWTAISAVSGVASLAGLTLAPTTFGTSLALSIGGGMGGYASSTAKDMDSLNEQRDTKFYCDMAQQMIDSEIETMKAEKIRLNSIIAQVKAFGIGSYKAYTLTKQSIQISNAIMSGEVSNASKILLNSSRWLNTLIMGYTAICIASDIVGVVKTINNHKQSQYSQQIRDAVSKLEENVQEIENLLKEEDEEDWIPYD